MKNVIMNHLLASIMFGVLVAVSGPPAWAQANSADSLQIVLVIGQSNMAGRAEVGEQPPLTHVSLLNDQGRWIPAKNPLNAYSSVRKEMDMQRLSPAYAFAREMVKSKDYRPLGLVVNAKGGTAIKEWMPGEELYTEAVRRAKQAQAQGTLIGIIWHQGESDAENPDHYLWDIEVLINSLREDLGAPSLPFVAGQLSEDQPQRRKFNQLILQLPEVVPNSAVVKSKGLTTFDKTHFDTKSQLTLGKRYAHEMKKLLKKQR